MGLWWKRSEPKKKKTIQEKHLEITANQPDSLLESFVRYVNRTRKDELKLSVDFKEAGVLTLHCQFKNEKNYEIAMRNKTPLVIQQNPELMIESLYKDETLNIVISEFHRMEEHQQDLNRLQWKIDNISFVYKGKTSPTAFDAMLEIKELTETKGDRQKEHDEYMEKIWYNSPYFAERLHAVYKAFLNQHTQSLADPVVADLTAILDDEELSDSTKQKAEQMLSEYRQQKTVSAEDKVASKENQALLTLSTIERHYLKGGEDVG